MIVAFHHADAGWKQSQIPVQEKLAELMVESVRKVMPGTPVVQFTNQQTRSLPFVDRVIRKDLKRGMDWIPFFLSFLEEQEEVLHLDTDLIVRKDLRRLSELDADMVITVRKKPILAEDGALMWVLLGVSYCRNPKVWTEVARRVSLMEREVDRNWWGVQLALWDMLQESNNGKSPFKILGVKQWEFNYTPLDDRDCPENVWAIHYKGEHRKDWMLRRWLAQPAEAHVSPAAGA